MFLNARYSGTLYNLWFEQRSEVSEGENHKNICRKNIPGRKVAIHVKILKQQHICYVQCSEGARPVMLWQNQQW
jgi:hypothetical protein